MMLRGGALVAATLALGMGVRATPDLLARVPLFDVATIRVVGAELLDDHQVLESAQIPDTANIWDDPAPWIAAVEAHPVVRSVRVRRRLPATLVLEIVEREAVAFLATPVLEPVDAEGRFLPVDPIRVRLDLPIVRLRALAGDTGSVRAPHRVRPQVEAVARLRENPAFLGRLSELREEDDGTVTAFWGSSPGLEIMMRLPVDLALVETGLAVLEQALAQDSTHTPRYIDLRWAEQVVVGYVPE
jgi:cell division protein FtsQ